MMNCDYIFDKKNCQIEKSTKKSAGFNIHIIQKTLYKYFYFRINFFHYNSLKIKKKEQQARTTKKKSIEKIRNLIRIKAIIILCYDAINAVE